MRMPFWTTSVKVSVAVKIFQAVFLSTLWTHGASFPQNSNQDLTRLKSSHHYSLLLHPLHHEGGCMGLRATKGSMDTPVAAPKERLTFSGDFFYQSDTIPTRTTATSSQNYSLKKDMQAYLKKPTTIQQLLSADGRKVHFQEVTPELLELWKEMCYTHYGSTNLPSCDNRCSSPRDDSNTEDMLICLDNETVFPGLRLIQTVCSAIQWKEDRQCYETILIADTQTVKGAPPLVWIFNQITGAASSSTRKQKAKKPRIENLGDDGENNNNRLALQKPKGSVKTIISVVESRDTAKISQANGSNFDEDRGIEYAFGLECSMQMRMEFPKTLLRILPSSKEKLEAQGSDAILKVIYKDASTAVDATREGFLATMICSERRSDGRR